jgi:fumarate hydratase, class II
VALINAAAGPAIGYDRTSAIAHKATDEDLTLKEAALRSGAIDEKRFDEIIDPKKWLGAASAAANPHISGGGG